MGLADLVAPEAAADGDDAQLGKDDGAPGGGKKDSEIVFLGAKVAVLYRMLKSSKTEQLLMIAIFYTYVPKRDC